MSILTRWFALLLFIPVFSACVGEDIVDDYVQPQLRVTNPISEIEAGTNYLFETSFLNNIGMPEDVSPEWSSSNTDLVTVSSTGLATGVAEGSAMITASFTDEFSETVSRSFELAVGASTVVIEEPGFRTGSVATTTFYELEGDFTLSELTDDQEGNLLLEFGDDYRADNGLPGLFVYLSNNPNSINGALEISRVNVFSGAHEYIVEDADLLEYRYVLYFCKPFNVKVGDGLIVE